MKITREYMVNKKDYLINVELSKDEAKGLINYINSTCFITPTELRKGLVRIIKNE